MITQLGALTSLSVLFIESHVRLKTRVTNFHFSNPLCMFKGPIFGAFLPSAAQMAFPFSPQMESASGDWTARKLNAQRASLRTICDIFYFMPLFPFFPPLLPAALRKRQAKWPNGHLTLDFARLGGKIQGDYSHARLIKCLSGQV